MDYTNNVEVIEIHKLIPGNMCHKKEFGNSSKKEFGSMKNVHFCIPSFIRIIFDKPYHLYVKLLAVQLEFVLMYLDFPCHTEEVFLFNHVL